MRVLALDTTTRAGSVALIVDDESRGATRIVERAGDSTRTHAQRLPADLAALLADYRLSWKDIDLFAVASGPGSFTGMRIGIATMQGLALVGKRPIVGVSALDALGHLGGQPLSRGQRVGAWMDAYRRDVFTALYEVDRASSLTRPYLREVEPPMVGAPADVLDRWTRIGSPSIFVGDGASAYADLVARADANARAIVAPLLAGAIGSLALARIRSGEAATASAVQPLYVRRPDAELAREHALAHRSADVTGRD